MGSKNHTFGAEMVSTGHRKYLTSQDSNRLKVQNLKINDKTTVVLHPALVALLSQRVSA
jgi:hypothetical protein